jgi:hypothetical protein
MKQLSIADAERLHGSRVDRRKKYASHDNESPHDSGAKIFELCTFTSACSGCSCECSMPYACGHGASGCKECGYTGKRITSIWLPYFGKSNDKKGKSRELHRPHEQSST